MADKLAAWATTQQAITEERAPNGILVRVLALASAAFALVEAGGGRIMRSLVPNVAFRLVGAEGATTNRVAHVLGRMFDLVSRADSAVNGARFGRTAVTAALKSARVSEIAVPRVQQCELCKGTRLSEVEPANTGGSGVIFYGWGRPGVDGKELHIRCDACHAVHDIEGVQVSALCASHA